MANSGRKVAGIEQALTAINQAQVMAGYPPPRANPVVRAARQGIRRDKGCAQTQKAALVVPHMRKLTAATDNETLLGIRDRAVLLLGFTGAFRRAEIAALNVEDITDDVDGLRVALRRSKTDQEGFGQERGIPFGSHPDTCPVRAVRAWLRASGLGQAAASGPLFVGVNRHGKLTHKRLDGGTVARVVKRAAAAAGLYPAKHAGHSLRAGLVTAAAQADKPEYVIMKQTGHASVQTVRRYIRHAKLFEENAAAGIGL